MPQLSERVEVVGRRRAESDKLQLLQRMHVHRRRRFSIVVVVSLAPWLMLVESWTPRNCSAGFFISSSLSPVCQKYWDIIIM